MKINTNQIPAEGLVLSEETDPRALELEIDNIRFQGPIFVKAIVSRITNTVEADVSLQGKIKLECSRCLSEYSLNLDKQFKLFFPVSGAKSVIDLSQDIREEIILDYPFKPLCSEGCLGLCSKCGKNLNEGGCSCGST